MPKYLVTIYYSASAEFEVEAPDEDSAIEQAKAIEMSDEEFMKKVGGGLEFEDAIAEEVK